VHLSRRQFIETSAVAIAGAQMVSGADPLLGLIVPVDRPIPEDDIPAAARKLKGAGKPSRSWELR